MPGCRIEGDASRAAYDTANGGAGLRLKRNAVAASLLSLYNPTDQAAWNRKGVTLVGLDLYGDKAFQTVASKGLSISHTGGAGGGSFIPAHRVRDLRVRDFFGDGVEFGAYTRDSDFDGLHVYGCMGYGVLDAGVDGTRANWNIGQSYKHGLYSVALEIAYANIKAWGSGQYNLSDPGTVAGFDPTTSSNFFFLKNLGVTCVNLKSQEAADVGIRIEGQGSDNLTGFIGTGIDSDGDCRMNSVSGTRAGINVFRAPNLQLEAFVGKRNAAFVGGPYYGLNIGTNSEGGRIVLTTSGVTSFDLQAASGGYGNDYSLNGHKGKQTVQAYAASFTPNPVVSEAYSMSLTGNVTVANPSRKYLGLRLRLIFKQDATGGRTVTFGTDFRVSWAPDTAGGKINVINFESDGTNWIQTGSAIGL